MMMLKKYFSLLLLLLCSTSALSSENEFNISEGEKSYIASIKKLRESLGEELPNVPGLHAIAPSSDKYTIVRLINDRRDVVDLVLFNENLYVTGFIVAGTYFRFNDREFNGITIPGTSLVPLNMSSHYSELERVAGTTRRATRVGMYAMNDAVRTLWRHNSTAVNDNVAKALLTLIVSVAESARFSQISSYIGNNFNGNMLLGADLSDLTNSWQYISNIALDMSQRAGANENYYNMGNNAINRNTIFGILALALCRQSSSTFNDTLNLDECSPSQEFTLIGDMYWSNDILSSTVL